LLDQRPWKKITSPLNHAAPLPHLNVEVDRLDVPPEGLGFEMRVLYLLLESRPGAKRHTSWFGLHQAFDLNIHLVRRDEIIRVEVDDKVTLTFPKGTVFTGALSPVLLIDYFYALVFE
jgi:hypothetical protein